MGNLSKLDHLRLLSDAEVHNEDYETCTTHAGMLKACGKLNVHVGTHQVASFVEFRSVVGMVALWLLL